ncbi:MAG: hypothetical protein J6A15_02795 [Clostridia bacterium]|nr:hypothetical protein [Clostridia bacterium]
MKSKKILVLIIIALIVVLFAIMMIIKSKKLSLSKMENEKEIVTEINNTDDKEKEDTEVIAVENNVEEEKVEEIQLEADIVKVKNTNIQEEPKKDPVVTQEKKVESSKAPETPKCSDSKHGVGVGNSNKWFNSYNEAVSYYDNLILDYSNKIHNGQITFEEYNKQCPCGYEIWSCQYCGKWTLNYYKR